jgi:hypothetical protein
MTARCLPLPDDLDDVTAAAITARGVRMDVGGQAAGAVGNARPLVHSPEQ